MFSIKFFRRLIVIVFLTAAVFALLRWGGLLPEKIYPRPYANTVEACCAAYGLDSNLAYAVMKAESNFRADAESRKGALGLMQLMEETAGWVAPKVGISVADRADILVPENNIRMGIWLLAYLQEQYEGDLTKVLCAYNAGSGNVEKWLAQEEHSKDGASLDAIPFGETKRYVEKVFRYYRMYQSIYAD